MNATGREDRRLTRDPRLWRVIIAAAFGVFAIEPVVTMGGVAIALASTVVESAGAGKSGLETALQGVLIGAGALAVLMSGVLVAFGRRSDAPAPTVAATPAQA
ncbi:MAG TPA: hypothetical protein VKH36_02180 [Acidimicrobiia bacterium]|nr:hypothetical protein [Acidimicrobiia bacterium]